MASLTAVNTVSSMNGLFKEVYANEIVDLMPSISKLTKMAKFRSAEKVGKTFNQPLEVTEELGFTHQVYSAGLFALNDAIVSEMANAQVDAYQTVLRTGLDYESLAKSTESKAAFKRATERVVRRMKISHEKRHEILALYGQRGLGQVESVTNTSGTTYAIVIKEESFAPSIWIGMKNLLLDGTASLTSPAATNSTAITVTAVDVASRTLTATITTIGSFAADDYLIFRGNASGSAWLETPGLDRLITNTGSLYGVSAATYDLWKGVQKNVSSANLSLAIVLDGIGEAVNNGLDQDVALFVSTKTFGKLISDQAALRKYDASYSNDSMENGARFIKFYGENGLIEVVPHGMVKRGEAFAVPKEGNLSRIGSTDTTFSLPGRGDEFFQYLENSAGIQLQSYSAWSLFSEAPSRLVRFYGIDNT